MSDAPPPVPGFTPPGTPPPPPPPPGNLAPPPGYVAYGGGNFGGFSPFERIKGLAKWVRVLVLVVAVANVLTTLVSLTLSDDADLYLAGDIDDTEFLSRYAPVFLFTLLGGVAMIALVVVTMIWMYRVAQNHRKLGRGGTWGPGWAIGGWFLLPVLFVIPFLMFRQLWKGSDPEVGPNDPRWEQAPVGPIVTVWWVLYGLIPALMIPLSVGAAFGGMGSSSADSVAEQVGDNLGLTLVSTVVSIGAAVAFFLLVKQLTARQMHHTREA